MADKTLKTFAQHYTDRQESARKNFIDYCTDVNGFTKQEADKIYAVYMKLKVIKIDGVLGKFNFKHGAYGDKEPMKAALEEYKNDPAKYNV